jgi:hypothetical protein
MIGRVVVAVGLIGLAVLPACAGPGSRPAPAVVVGSGRIQSEARPVAGFDAVRLVGAGTLAITQGSAERLTVETDENVLPLVGSEVRGGTLVLGPQRSPAISWPIRYALTVQRLSRIEIDGAGEVSALEVRTGALSVDLRGAATVTVGGQADAQRVTIAGAGTYQASGLATRETVVEINGAGTALVNASERLRAVVNGVGTVEYVGDPSVERTINGLGTVKRRS